jgi:hypothetical protein
MMALARGGRDLDRERLVADGEALVDAVGDRLPERRDVDVGTFFRNAVSSSKSASIASFARRKSFRVDLAEDDNEPLARSCTISAIDLS